MAKTKQYIEVPELPESILKVVGLFQQHIDTTGAILEDYVVGNDGMFIELGEAHKSFLEAVKEIEIEDNAEKLIEKLGDQNLNESEYDSLLKVLVGQYENTDDKLLGTMDADDIAAHLSGKGYSIIKVDSAKREKLKDFIESEIYPYYNDQKAFVNI